MKSVNGVENIHCKNASDNGQKAFVLWQEVLLAYVMPSIMAGIGGLFTSDVALSIRACTTIGGASALFALLIGLWLQKRGNFRSWIVFEHKTRVVGLFSVIGFLFGLIAASILFGLLEFFIQSQQISALNFVWIDLPLSATIACTLVAWRWKCVIHNNVQNGGDKK
ncbi:hypothetical protein [Lysinibacillus sp. NPDC092081]|uniref:hypothetical protein n=1 Tax=Lysinibacillus sp. NPDC092081 TaxID=3364131 RepID=UPI0038055D31